MTVPSSVRDLPVADQVQLSAEAAPRRSQLSYEALRDAACALRLSVLDNCNALSVNSPILMIRRLQTQINGAAVSFQSRNGLR